MHLIKGALEYSHGIHETVCDKEFRLKITKVFVELKWMNERRSKWTNDNNNNVSFFETIKYSYIFMHWIDLFLTGSRWTYIGDCCSIMDTLYVFNNNNKNKRFDIFWNHCGPTSLSRDEIKSPLLKDVASCINSDLNRRPFSGQADVLPVDKTSSTKLRYINSKI